MKKKTWWQEVYSWLGFWSYYQYDERGNRWRIIYWCCFPFRFIRKFDVFRYISNET